MIRVYIYVALLSLARNIFEAGIAQVQLRLSFVNFCAFVFIFRDSDIWMLENPDT